MCEKKLLGQGIIGYLYKKYYNLFHGNDDHLTHTCVDFFHRNEVIDQKFRHGGVPLAVGRWQWPLNFRSYDHNIILLQDHEKF